jgi:hypothetical protein
MKAQALTAALAAVGVTCTAVSVAAPASTAKKGEPLVRQMVVFRDGKTHTREVRAKRAVVDVGGRSCTVAAATPLAALVRSKPGRISYFDYGSCSRRAQDASGLMVKGIRGQRNVGFDGWVYKVGRKLATAGAADPAGPFGDRRLRGGQRVIWFYCEFTEGSCQRSLELTHRMGEDASSVEVMATAYDDAGKGAPAAGVTVSARGSSVSTASDGEATLTLDAGRSYTLRARKRGLIPSFPVKVTLPG